MADPHEHAVEVEALVQRLRGARQRRLLGDLRGLPLRELQLGQAGGRGGRESARHLHRVRVEVVGAVCRQHKQVPHRAARVHGQQEMGSRRDVGPAERLGQLRGVFTLHRHRRGVAVDQGRDDREGAEGQGAGPQSGGGTRGERLQPGLAGGDGEEHGAGHAEEFACLVHEALLHGLGALLVDRH